MLKTATDIMSFPYAQAMLQELNVGGHPNLVALFEHACEKFAGRIAFTARGQSMSFAELERWSGAVASWLLEEAGLSPGERIAIQLPNLAQYPIVAWGVLRAGMIVVNTNPLYTQREVEHQFNDSGATTLFALADLIPQLEMVIPRTGISRVVTTSHGDLVEPLPAPETTLPGVSTLPQILSWGAGRTVPRCTSGMNSIALLQYTGGTTGPAKGAVLTHGNLYAGSRQSQLALAIDERAPDIVIAPMPLYHIYGFTAHLVTTFSVGGRSILVPDPRDMDELVGLMKAHPFTAMAGVNTLFAGLMAHPGFDDIDFSHVKRIISGGAALVEEIAEEWYRRTGILICEGYGLSETSATLTCNRPDDRQLGTVGKPLPCMETKIVGKADERLQPGAEGELLVRGPQVMNGYWNRSDATAEAIDEDGWFRTGDIARLQKDGYVKICDRLKDMILVSGFNVYPNEVEGVVYTHPDVVECAAVGIADEKTGEAVKLYVVSSNPDLCGEALRDFCKVQLTAYKVPRYIEFRRALPKSNVGKILRREMRE